MRSADCSDVVSFPADVEEESAVWAAATAATPIITNKAKKSLFMLDLTALARVLRNLADWMPSGRGKGASILPRAKMARGKTVEGE